MVTTSKGSTTTKAKISNAANVTPQLVSGIKMHSGLQDLLLGLDVAENFAVGDVAVNSKAAVAMYLATAQDPANAQAASTALTKSVQTIPEAPPLELAPLARAYVQFALDATKKAKFDAAAQKVGYTDFRTFLMAAPAPTQDQIKTARTELETDNDIKARLLELDKSSTSPK